MLDGRGGEDQAWVQFNVVDVNRPPIIEPIADQQVEELVLLELDVVAWDPDSDEIACSVASLPDAPGASLSGDPLRLSWTPAYGDFGRTFQFTVTCQEVGGSGLEVHEDFAVLVLPVGCPVALPEIPVLNAVEGEDFAYTFVPWAQACGLTCSILDEPPAALFDTTTCTLTWRPSYEDQGTHTPEVTVTDGAAQGSALCEIQVQNVNRAPVVNVPGQATPSCRRLQRCQQPFQGGSVEPSIELQRTATRQL